MNRDIKPQTLFDLADACAREGKYEEAIQLYLQLRDRQPEDDSVLMALAWTFRDAGRMAEAVECFELLVEKELSRQVFTGFAFDELVRIFKSGADYDRLVRLCERAVAAQPDDVALLYTLGDSLFRAGRAADAVSVFEKLTGMEPDAPVYWCALGDAMAMSGEAGRAEEAYEEAAAIDPEGAAAFYHRLGCTFMEAGDLDRAEGALMKSLDLSDLEPLRHCTLGDVYIRQGNIAKALQSYEYAVSISSGSGGALYNRLGNSLIKFRRFREAAAAFEEAVGAEPHNPFYCRNLIESYEEAGMGNEARRAWEEACARGVFSE